MSDALYESARRELGDAPLVELSLAVATINAWNRINVALATPAGHYKPRR